MNTCKNATAGGWIHAENSQKQTHSKSKDAITGKAHSDYENFLEALLRSRAPFKVKSHRDGTCEIITGSRQTQKQTALQNARAKLHYDKYGNYQGIVIE